MKRLLLFLLLLPVAAIAQTDSARYLNIAGGTFITFNDARALRGTDGIIVNILTRDSIVNGRGDGYGGQFSWCNTCMQADDNYTYLKVRTMFRGRWVRVNSRISTALPAGTYNRLMIDQNGGFAGAYYDSSAVYAMAMAQMANATANATLSALQNIQLTPGPRGEKGEQGNDGTAATVQVGTVSTGAAGTNAVVTNSGNSKNAVLNFTIPRGADGTNGQDGAQGIPGTNGIDAPLPVFSVTTGTAGSNATISGTYPNLTISVPRGNTGAKGDPGSNANVTAASVAAALGYTPLASEVDASTTNELQTLSISGQQLSISQGNSVTLPVVDTNSLSARINAKQNAGAYLVAEVDGSVTNEIQTLGGSGNTVTLTGGGSYTIPAQAYSSLTGTPTIPAQYNPTAGTGIAITGTYPNQTISNTAPAVTYTAGNGITISGNTISATGLTATALPNVTISESALIAIGAGWRNVTVTCTGVQTGDRLQINPLTAPTGYAIGQAVATANNTIVVQVWAPLLAIGASYSIVCKVAAFR